MRLESLIEAALDEDLGPGDLTTDATIPLALRGEGPLLAKQPMVVCGHHAARAVFKAVCLRVGGDVSYEVLVDDGMDAAAGVPVARVAGSLRAIVIGERTALNFLMRLSGIATHTRRFVSAAGGNRPASPAPGPLGPASPAPGPLGPVVVDTRKTTPLHRALEKHAVRCGGGRNHRYALYDGVLVKDNHVDAVGSLSKAVALARAHAHHLVRVEVEVRTLAEVDEALGTAASVLLLDNMDDAMLRAAIARARERRPEVLLEASGNMTLERVAAIRDFGLDFVSIGGLIHQATWSDLSLKVRRTGS